jgi:cytochrome c oxidase subunit 2
MNLLVTLADIAPFLPQNASNLGKDVDWAWNIILGVTSFFFFIVVGAMVYFVIRYRRRHPNDQTSEITHNTPLEIIWTVVPLILVIAFFFVGFKGFMNYDTPDSNSTIVDVQASMWSFQFTYPNGAVSDQLYVVKDKPVRLNLHSIDVLHAIYLPNFRTQRNLIPYRQTTIWFIPTLYSPEPKDTSRDPGGFPIFCTQYCGAGHSRMFTHCHVLSQADYDDKMKELANPFKKKEGGKSVYVPYKELGAKLYTQMGCSTCHSVEANKILTGPSWKGLWKSKVDFSYSNVAGYTLEPGDSDEKWVAYIHESMVDPGAKIVKNFQNVMPTFASQLGGNEANDEKARAIIEYMKSIGTETYTPAADPEKQPELFDADKNQLHPESLKAIAARATQPAH